jgi:hypothetical protein
MIPIIDISQHQGAANFSTTKARGVRGIIMRVSHGMTLDTRVTNYYRDAIAAGFTPEQLGFYSFINPKRGSGVDTARFAAEAIERITGRTKVLYMLDVESYQNESPNVGQSPVSGYEFSVWLRQHMAEFRRLMPDSYIIGYTNKAYWDSAQGPRDRMLASALEWLVPRYPLYSQAAYQTRGYPPTPSLWGAYARGLAAGPNPPQGAEGWEAWQFSAGFNKQGPVYGFQSSDLDLNIVDPEAWKHWSFQRDPVPEPDPIPQPDPVVIGEIMSNVIVHKPTRIFNQVIPAGDSEVEVAPDSPVEAVAALLNLTALMDAKPGYVSVWDGEGSQPATSQVNYHLPAVPHNGFAITGLRGRKFKVWSKESVRLIIDQVGYALPPKVEQDPIDEARVRSIIAAAIGNG